MNTLSFNRSVAFFAVFGSQVVCLSADPDPMREHADGLYLDSVLSDTYIIPWNSSVGRRSVNVGAETGGFMFYSGMDESGPMALDGGITMFGNPIAMVLMSSNPTSYDDANFSVWAVSTYSSFGQPLLNINGQTGDTTFTNSDVIINSGTLTVGGSPVVTSSVLTSGGYVNTSNFNSTLSAATPPTSSAWTAAYVPRGNVAPVGFAEGGLLALGTSTASGFRSFAAGTSATASGSNSLALGHGAVASGSYAIAMGANPVASGGHSFARGGHVVAAGFGSNAMGYGAVSNARAETAVGTWNIESVVSSGSDTNGLYGLFRVGNGTSTSVRSDALTVLMNGQTTLTNKEWKAAVVADPAKALADPDSTTDSSGNALVVDGHTVLNGKVIIAVPQGDISMGDYQ